MNVQFDPADLRPLVQAVVAETLAAVATLPGDRLGFSEAEAAELCGISSPKFAF